MRILNEFRREGLGRLFLPVACGTLAVAALASVRVFDAQVEAAFSREERTMAGGDLEVSAPRRLSDEQRALIRSSLPAGSREAEAIEFLSMASDPATGRTRLVEVRAAGPEYPPIGRPELEPPLPLEALQGEREQGREPPLFAAPELEALLGVRTGSKVKLGERTFRLAALVRREPGLAAGAFSLGPRVWIPLGELEATGLARAGSRLRHRLLLVLPEAGPTDANSADAEARVATAQATLVARLADSTIRVRSWRESNPQLRGFHSRLGEFLGLLGLFVALLSGVGLAAATRSELRRQTRSIAVLRCLGATTAQLYSRLLARSLVIAGLGAAFGAGLGALLAPKIPGLLGDLGEFALPGGVPPLALLEAAVTGTALSLCFSWIGLADLPSIRPLMLLRPSAEPRRPGPARAMALAATALLFFGLGWRQTGSPWNGAAVVGGTVAVALVLFGLYLAGLSAFQAALSRLGFLPFPARYGLRNLVRLRAQSSLTLTVLALGSALLGAASLLRAGMLQELDAGASGARPSLFLVDVGQEQREAVVAELGRAGLARQDWSKLVSARLLKVNSAGVDGDSDPENRAREFRLSERGTLYPTERVIEGRFWSEEPVPPGSTPDGAIETEASIEAQWGKRARVKLGDLLEFEIQGVPLRARVTSVRKVRWTSFQPNFFVLLRPGALEGAPFQWIAAVGGGPSGAKTRAQEALGRDFPTLSSIDIDEAASKLTSIIRRIEQVVQFLSLFTLAAGLVVLALVSAENAGRRAPETSMIRALGATRPTLLGAIAAESLALALGAAVPAGLGAAALVAGVLAPRFGIPAPGFTLEAGILLAAVAAGIWGTAFHAAWRASRVSASRILGES